MLKFLGEEHRNLEIIALAAIEKIAGFNKTEEMEKDLRECGNVLGCAVLNALDQTLSKLQYDRNKKFIRCVVIGITWKALHGTSYSPVFTEFLCNLKTELSKIDLEFYRHPPNEWTVNKGAAIEKARQKRDKEKL